MEEIHIFRTVYALLVSFWLEKEETIAEMCCVRKIICELSTREYIGRRLYNVIKIDDGLGHQFVSFLWRTVLV